MTPETLTACEQGSKKSQESEKALTEEMKTFMGLAELRLQQKGLGEAASIEQKLRGRKGKQADGPAKTHEVKVGCVFSQSPRAGVEALRDPGSTSYIATMKRTGMFGPKLLREARRIYLGGKTYKALRGILVSTGGSQYPRLQSRFGQSELRDYMV